MSSRIKQTEDIRQVCFSPGKAELMTESVILIFLLSLVCKVHVAMLYNGFLHHRLAAHAYEDTSASVSHRTSKQFFLGWDSSPSWGPCVPVQALICLDLQSWCTYVPFSPPEALQVPPFLQCFHHISSSGLQP